jgi:cold shock protein
MEGVVKWFNEKKGFGFILGEDGTDYFVHVRSLPKDTKLNEKDKVSFTWTEGKKGRQANNIVVR